MIEKLSNNIYAETGVRGCNHSFVVTSEGIVMIDTPQLPTDAVKWREEIAKFGSVRYIINTEPHGDHFSGSYFFEGTIVAHEGTRESILGASVNQYTDMLKQMDPSSLPLVNHYSFRVPTITLTNKMTIYLGKHTFQLINFPGHTPYQVAVFVPEEKVLFTSDNVVHQTMPFITPQALPFEWMESLRQMQKLDVKMLVPGHGNVCDKTYLTDMIAGIQAWIDTVADAIKRGMSLEEAQSKIDLLDRYPLSSTPRERSLQTQRMNIARVYQVLKGEMKSR
jgi:cyclase